MFGHAVLFVFSSLGSFLILKCFADFRVSFFGCFLFCFVLFVCLLFFFFWGGGVGGGNSTSLIVFTVIFINCNTPFLFQENLT